MKVNTFAVQVAKLLVTNPELSTQPFFFADLADELERYGFKLQGVRGTDRTRVKLVRVKT